MCDACQLFIFCICKITQGRLSDLEWFTEMSLLKLVTFQSYISTNWNKNHSSPRQEALDGILDVCEEPSIQNDLVFSQKEKAVRENWQTAVAAYTGYNIQTQAKKWGHRKETNTRKQSKEFVSVIRLPDCYSHINIEIYIMMLETSMNQLHHIYCLNTMYW